MEIFVSAGPDEAILDPRPNDVLEHTLLDVLCTCGNCLPACTVKWALNDELFQQSDRLRLNASRDTEGRYTCNCINMKSFESKTADFYLSVRCKYFANSPAFGNIAVLREKNK